MAKELRRQAFLAAECEAWGLTDTRLVYSATERCYCGQGLAYDCIQDPEWSCASLLLGKTKTGRHKADMPFSLAGIEVENGTSTRPKC